MDTLGSRDPSLCLKEIQLVVRGALNISGDGIKGRYCGSTKNTAQEVMLSNLWMVYTNDHRQLGSCACRPSNPPNLT